MNTIKLVLVTIGLCLVQILAKAQAQAGKISGVVLDQDKKPVDGATVVLQSAKDSVTVKTALGNTDGSFSLDNLKDGDYKLVVSLLGYGGYKSGVISIANQQNVKLPVIAITRTSKALKEVSVTAQKAFVEQKIDRTVVNVNSLISNTGATAYEALQNTPGVLVDDNGNISFKGKSGVMVMIDDKPTYLSGDNLASYLKSIPASQLEQIELMSNPPAKYDASGNAGVINIKTKKSKAKGFNGSLAASVGVAAYWRTNESLNLNYHDDKVNIFANLAYNISSFYRMLTVTRKYYGAGGGLNSTYDEYAFFKSVNRSPNIKAGMDYFLSPKTTIAFVLTGSTTGGYTVNPTKSVLGNRVGAVDSNVIADNNTHTRFNNGGINLNYSHRYNDPAKVITIDLDYLKYNNAKNQTFFNNTYAANGALKSVQNISDNLPTDINIYSAKTDYAQPLPNKGKFETGLKTSYVNTDNAANYFNLVNNVSLVDNTISNSFMYKENINAAYINFNQEFKRLAIQAGLRVENTNVNGHQLGNAVSRDSAFGQHYTNLFPTAYALYKLDTAGSHTLKFSYGRRIDRPYYQDLNPFITIIDKYSQFGGNPFLKPQNTSVYDLTYAYKSAFSVTLEHTYTSDYWTEVDEQMGNVFFATSRNLGHRSHFNLITYLSLSPTKWWNFNVDMELVHNSFEGQLVNTYLSTATTYFYSTGTSQFNLSHGWNAELNYFYISPYSDAQFTHIQREQVNASVSKKLFGNKVTARLIMRDIFRGNFSGGNITNIPNVAATYYNDFANRALIFGFTYNFGTTPKNEKKHDNSVDEQGRVRN